MGRNQKEEQKSKGAGKVNSGRGKAISQVAKFVVASVFLPGFDLQL